MKSPSELPLILFVNQPSIGRSDSPCLCRCARNKELDIFYQSTRGKWARHGFASEEAQKKAGYPGGLGLEK